MNKALIVAKREFLSRVQKKTFLLTTIGLPLLIFGFYALIILFTVSSGSNKGNNKGAFTPLNIPVSM